MNRTPYARHKKPLNSDMNVVPYIDVMLVLLVIFMVTAPMLTTGVEVDLPSEKTGNIKKDTQLPVIISITADGALFISHDSTLDEPLTEAALIERVTNLAIATKDDSGSSQLQVMINADANNEYRAIMHLMAALQQAGVNKIGLLTDAPQSPQKK